MSHAVSGRRFFSMGTVFRYALRRCRRVAAAVFPVLAGGPVSWMIFRYATSGAWRTGSGARAACGLPVSAPVSGAMSFPVLVCRCRVVAGMESAWGCLRACQSGLRFCRVPVPRSLTGRVLPPFSGLRVPGGTFVPRSGMCGSIGQWRVAGDGARRSCRRDKKKAS